MSEPVWGVLTRAAGRLQDVAMKAEQGPWRAYPDCGLWSVESTGEMAVCTDAEDSAEWIAMMSPVVAAPLVEWLRASHARAERQARDVPEPLFWGVFWKDHRHAVDFAHAVLGVDRG